MPAYNKVFGIGLQRTGTTSMTSALNVLGFNSYHFPAQLWDDVDDPVLNEYDAFFDNPIPLLYQELDRKCPGSKFILTVRDENAWQESCHRLFAKHREEWELDSNKYIKEMHIASYGIDHFDEEAFRKAYREHVNEVKSYFRDRPEDLLIFDIASDDQWEELCPFLNKEVPDQPFPHKHKSGIIAETLRRTRSMLSSAYCYVKRDI
jgi:hypothetical protein